MLAAHAAPQNLVAIRALIIVLAVSGLIFWRAALKIILAVAAMLLVSGAIAFAQGFLHILR